MRISSLGMKSIHSYMTYIKKECTLLKSFQWLFFFIYCKAVHK